MRLFFTLSDTDLYQSVVALKQTNPSLKIHLAVGGASAGTWPFESLASSSINMYTFATNAASYLRAHGFDGLDLDWEFPGTSFKHAFTQLCEILFTQFHTEAMMSGMPRLLLSAAVSGYKVEIEKSYEPLAIHQ